MRPFPTLSLKFFVTLQCENNLELISGLVCSQSCRACPNITVGLVPTSRLGLSQHHGWACPNIMVGLVPTSRLGLSQHHGPCGLSNNLDARVRGKDDLTENRVRGFKDSRVQMPFDLSVCWPVDRSKGTIIRAIL